MELSKLVFQSVLSLILIGVVGLAVLFLHTVIRVQYIHRLYRKLLRINNLNETKKTYYFTREDKENIIKIITECTNRFGDDNNLKATFVISVIKDLANRCSNDLIESLKNQEMSELKSADLIEFHSSLLRFEQHYIKDILK